MSNAISVSRGLVELKLLDARINRAITEAKFVGVKVGDKVPTGYKDLEEFNTKAKSSYDSIQDLVKRRNLIKGKIVESNAKTEVEINGVKYTVANAIERKSSISYERTLLATMVSSFGLASRTTDATNVQVNAKLQILLEANFGKDTKANEGDVEAISKPFLKKNEAALIDPLDVKEKIEKLQNSIEGFLSEVDLALSESNVLSKIDVD